VKSVSSSFSKDLSHEAKAKTKDFKIVIEDPRGRGLVLEDSNTVKCANELRVFVNLRCTAKYSIRDLISDVNY